MAKANRPHVQDPQRTRESRPATIAQPIYVTILGAGKGGVALLELLTRCPGVDIIGVADIDPEAPGLRLARLLGIQIFHDAVSLMSQEGADLIIDVTGDAAVASLIEQTRSPTTETLGGTAARLFWSVIQQEQELQGQLMHAEKLATMGIFAAGIAHELNNPLHCMLGFAQLIQEANNPAAIQDYAQQIVDMIIHLSGTTKSLSLYARASGAGEAVSVSLPHLLDEALTMAKFGAVMDEVTVIRDYATMPAMRVDPSDLLQIFVNVIVNAAEAMNGRGQLTVTAGNGNGLLTLSFQDTGCGISPDDLPHVLSPFFTTKERGKGTGLGLYIVQMLLNKYHGRLDIESQKGRGTAVHLHFSPT